MSKNFLTKNEFLEGMSEFLTVADVLAAEAISDVSVAIIKKRINLEKTQKEFAHYMGVSQGMISKWENGDYNFTLKAIAEICEKLELRMNLTLEEYSSITADWVSEVRAAKQIGGNPMRPLDLKNIRELEVA